MKTFDLNSKMYKCSICNKGAVGCIVMKPSEKAIITSRSAHPTTPPDEYVNACMMHGTFSITISCMDDIQKIEVIRSKDVSGINIRPDESTTKVLVPINMSLNSIFEAIELYLGTELPMLKKVC